MNRISDLKRSWDRLAVRERRMVIGLAVALVLVVVFLFGFIIQSGIEELEENNAAIRKALVDLEQHKDAFVAQRQRQATIDSRIRGGLELNGFLETKASAAGVSIAESGEIQPVQGDRYVQRGMEIKLRKVSIEQLAKFMKEIETSEHLVQITSLSINTRWNQHQDLDVEMTVSTYERKEGGGGTGTRAKDRT
jgi:type II secretory pathway component PulM